MEKPLVEKFSNYEITGLVKLEDWTGNIGVIKMTPAIIHKNQFIDLNNHQNCIEYINDAGFGCKNKLAAIITVWKVYEHGGKVIWYSDSFNLQNLNKKLSQEEYNSLIEYYDY